MQYAIVTGSSRGLGEAIAEQMIEKNVNIIAVSRSENEKLKKKAEERKVDYFHVSCDLSDSSQLDEGLDRIMDIAFNEDTHYVYLVNNAGVIEPIDTIGNLDADAVQKHIQVNLTAPVLIINRLIKEANQKEIRTFVINITSGAAERSVHGWSTYSTTKAAINRFTETLALEQEGNGHKVLAYSPGVIDTDMQGEIRSSSAEQFAEVDKFKQLKEEGKLRSPEEVAAVLMDLINQPDDIENGKVYKLYDLVEKQ
ncbi:(S)-benzoin forming benzil reductase [Halobacillus sp. BBL2006]|uniref:(S)-benzoin forming benzil reductase n=1 Tax=Halobacillus sp. BBL2006 TaxID=1543706 RepID=UPI0005425085|nr:(S)-benzoin forming benzil reductase [Halobacillus sp. BBL2006]KHE68599.1 short-chain dehydrogenase [Halobacillus sp. BBL2006]